jgi:hypothetical protein
MGIANQVAELEDELADTRLILNESQQECNQLEDQVNDLKAELEEERGFVDWVETNYPDARATYNALIKVKGEQL